ncbi:MAG: hypothetical protein SXV54_15865 [Chloroflexota bacterium]|nr:hypothetical protein [Chloroflexota bacterium]
MTRKRSVSTMPSAWLLVVISLFLTACGTLEVGIEHDATPDQPATPRDLTPSPQQPVIPTPTPAAPLPGLIYRTDEGLWMADARGQPVQILDRADVGEHSVPAISPDGGYALYLEKDADDLDLWLADLTTGKRRNLTRTPDSTETNFRWWSARPDVVLFSSRPQEIEPGPGVTGFLTVVGIDGTVYRVLDDQNHTGGPPAPSPDGQTIAYGSGSTGWLYHWETGSVVFDPEEYGVPGYRNITIGSPAWSLDGSKLAWIVNGDFADKSTRMGVGVFDMEAQTAQVLHLYEPAFGDGWPAAPVWSPDGEWLAFTAWAQNPDEAGVWVVRADGQYEEGSPSLFTEYYLGGSHPVWSPDGRWLVFNRTLQDGGTSYWAAQTGTWGLIRLNLPPDAYVVDWIRSQPSPSPGLAATATSTPLPTTAAPTPTPITSDAGDGLPSVGLIYRTADGLWYVNDLKPVRVFDHRYAAISPDFTQILYEETDGSWDDIWLADLTTGERRNLTQTPSRSECCAQWWPGQPDTILFSSWSPEDAGINSGFPTVVQLDGSDYHILDDSQVSYALPAPSPDGQTVAYDRAGQAWLYQPDTGSKSFDLTPYGLSSDPQLHVYNPAWSPDGRRLAWIVGDCREGECQRSIGIFDLEAQTAQLLHPHSPAGIGGWPPAPVWSPDGRWLAFAAWAENPDDAGLWVLRADGQQEEEYHLALGQGRATPTPVWSPDGNWLAFSGASRDGRLGHWLAEVGTWEARFLDLPLDTYPLDAYLVDWVSSSWE